MYCNFSGIENTLLQNSLLQYTALHPPRSPFSFLLQAPQKRSPSKIFQYFLTVIKCKKCKQLVEDFKAVGRK